MCSHQTHSKNFWMYLEPTNTFWMQFFSRSVYGCLKMSYNNIVVRKFVLNIVFEMTWKCIIIIIIITGTAYSACCLGAGLYTGKSSFSFFFSMTLLFICTELSASSLCNTYIFPLMCCRNSRLYCITVCMSMSMKWNEMKLQWFWVRSKTDWEPV